MFINHKRGKRKKSSVLHEIILELQVPRSVHLAKVSNAELNAIGVHIMFLKAILSVRLGRFSKDE